ncbi:hypothetical protein [Coleofasciculus sp.]|uniref:hypothetical protein n=1 Tax=Coleofasciculus sp. TaxID=3100458 RepID=UPI0039FA2683
MKKLVVCQIFQLFVKVYEGVSLDLASFRLYSRVTFQAIASPCPFGAITHYWMEQLPAACAIA